MTRDQFVEAVIALEKLEEAEDHFNGIMVPILIEEGVAVPFTNEDGLGDVTALVREFRERIGALLVAAADEDDDGEEEGEDE